MGDVTTIPAGWYPDPENSARSRWWNGSAWTASVSEPQPAPPQEPFIPQVTAPQRAVEQLPFVATEPEATVERETAQPFNPQQSELQRLLKQATPPAAPVAGALTRRQLRELTSGGGVAEPTPVVPTAQIPAPSAAPGTPFGDVAVMPAANPYSAPVASFDDLLAGTETAAPDAAVLSPEPVQASAPPVEPPLAVTPVAPVVVEPEAVQPVPYVEPPMPSVNPYSQPDAHAPAVPTAFPGAAVATVPSTALAAPAAPQASAVLTPEPMVNPYSTPAPPAQHSGPISTAALFAPVPTSANAFGAAPAAAFAAAPAYAPATAAPAAHYGSFPAAATTGVPAGAYAPFSAETARPIPVISSLLPTSTLSIWIFALWPLILSAGLVAAFLSFDVMLDIPAAAFGGLYVVMNLLLASNDKKKLESVGHDRGVGPWWSLLPLIFLIIRTARLGARSVAPLIVWLLAQAASLVVGFYGFQMIAAQAGIEFPTF
jgi:hypothetical protein